MKESQSNYDFEFQELEQQLRSLKPAPTPPELTQKLLKITSSEQSSTAHSSRLPFLNSRSIPWAVAAMLALLFITIASLWFHTPQPQVARVDSPSEFSLPTLDEVKGKALKFVGVSKIIASGIADQDAALAFFKSVDKKQFGQLASSLETMKPLPPERKEEVLKKTNVMMEALAAGAPTFPTLALTSATFFPKTKN
ncbi:MAG TPA: hypothetical protein PLV91_08270 [Verrucomicrobiota bacterium]|jgi:hypothetical protein|nr:hypothetical protein [Verrucomicrobiota bacterium]